MQIAAGIRVSATVGRVPRTVRGVVTGPSYVPGFWQITTPRGACYVVAESTITVEAR